MWKSWLLFASLSVNALGGGFAVGWVAIPLVADAVRAREPAGAHPAPVERLRPAAPHHPRRSGR